MSYKIVVDSCCDLTAEMRGWENLQVVPLSLKIADYEIFDDENFDQDDFIARMKANSGKAKSACPAPDAFKQACEGDYDEVYVLTITDKLSGTYNSALQGKMLYEEEFNDNKKIHVFNSLATSGLETIVAQEIKKLGDEGKSFDDMVSYIEDYIENHTGLYFCLDSLDALKQNGRLFALAAGLLEKIHLKLICKAKEGNISPQGKDLTINRALVKMTKLITDEVAGKDLSNKKLVITHVCCKDRAEFVANKIAERAAFGEVVILKTSGLNSLYASDGGIIVSYSC
ncbi:MAG: DegV family protein [Eubacterium sp.]|nr:DegV family protein [Eubacterium sp.]MDE6155330.1 DegV family protein [Eubacterium sp.]